MSGCLEMATRDNFKGLSNVDYKSSWTVGRIVPLLIFAPDLEARDWNREEQCCETKIGVAVHSDVLRFLEYLFVDRSEKGVAEVALAGGRAVRLHVVPKPIIG